MVVACDWATDVPDLTDASSGPAHARIERWLTDVIGRGDLVPGDRLPPEGDLAALLGVSRMTLRQALGRLEAIGTVVRKPGRSGGTFVDEPKILCDLTGLAGFTEQMRRANVRAGARVVRDDHARREPRGRVRALRGARARRCTRSSASGRPTGSRWPWSGRTSRPRSSRTCSTGG